MTVCYVIIEQVLPEVHFSCWEAVKFALQENVTSQNNSNYFENFTFSPVFLIK